MMLLIPSEILAKDPMLGEIETLTKKYTPNGGGVSMKLSRS